MKSQASDRCAATRSGTAALIAAREFQRLVNTKATATTCAKLEDNSGSPDRSFYATTANRPSIAREQATSASTCRPTKMFARGCDTFFEMGDDSPEETEESPDYERDLGVVEAITMVTRSCPSGVVVASAERALEAIKEGGPDVMKQQAYFVLTALQGWRGDRARQIHRSLTKYLE